ncbi:MAG TPA: carbamoyl-phosphate synthase large subunit, partial [Actinomycetota bacterium]|nr:carbamoyl-phosphate synthase large subunit [Actinomycetota bacterium]
MPRRTDVQRILVIGSGPIVIGQACEFDYSGTQACAVLRREGYHVSLVNPNPATIMTDPEFADATYLEPLTHESMLSVIERERPDAMLPTMGGQTGLNVAVELAESGELDRLGVRLIGASPEAIHRAEDRSGFHRSMVGAGLPVPRSGIARTVDEAMRVAGSIGYPVIVRPSFMLGGGGSGFATDPASLAELVARSLAASPATEVLVEESLAGWKEFELEVMRDAADNAVVVCSIENVDPMGVHTGDSITVAPQQTLTDREYQDMRDAALACIRAIGVETGGSNIQFAVSPRDGRMVVIEMNPRVSRSSALASKATGFPIAKVAALLAVGYRLDEIANDITGQTPAAFEPTLDYVVVKVPRFAFEKFPQTDPALTSTMKSVGEVMAIGRTFKEALGKAWRSVERSGFDLGPVTDRSARPVLPSLGIPAERRLHLVEAALAAGHSVEEVAHASGIDPWFVDQIAQVVEETLALHGRALGSISHTELREAKRVGLSDARIAQLTDST